MILGFNPQFKQPILDGTKIHSIREDKHKRWKIGRLIHFATGVRTKLYQQFLLRTCMGTQKIKIEYDNIPPIGDSATVMIDGEFLDFDGMELLAKNDGFESISDFFEWFNKDFSGKIIHWTNLKY